MTSDQVRDVKDLTRAAGITPTITRLHGADHPVLRELAPGERSLPGALVPVVPATTVGAPNRSAGTTGGGARRSRRRTDQPRSAASPAVKSSQHSNGSGRSAGQSDSSRRRRPAASSSGSHSIVAFSSGRRG